MNSDEAIITGMDINIEWLLLAAQRKKVEDNKKKLDKKHDQ